MTEWRRMNEDESSMKIHEWKKKLQMRENLQMRKRFTDEELYTNKIKEKIKRKIIFMRR